MGRDSRCATLAVLVAILGLGVMPAAAQAELWVPLPRGPITVLRQPCPDYPDALGCVRSDQPDTIYWADGDHGTLEHELGHIFDRRQLDDGERNAIKRRLHKTDMAWCDTATYQALAWQKPSNAPPCEDFADAYSNCRLHRWPDDEDFDVSSYGYNPTRRQHRKMCALIRRATD